MSIVSYVMRSIFKRRRKFKLISVIWKVLKKGCNASLFTTNQFLISYQPNQKMNDIISPPSKWVSEMIARIEPGGTLIDIACGRGRHSIEFSEKFFIYSVDKNNEFLNNLKNNMNIKTICQDLENQQKWSFSDKKFNVVLVTNYLFREKLNAIFSLVDLNGYIIYETFAIGNEKYGRPSNPNYLLKKNELLLFKPDNFDTIEFFEGLKIDNSKDN